MQSYEVVTLFYKMAFGNEIYDMIFAQANGKITVSNWKTYIIIVMQRNVAYVFMVRFMPVDRQFVKLISFSLYIYIVSSMTLNESS